MKTDKPTAKELQSFLNEAFALNTMQIEEAGEQRARIRLPFEKSQIRPGGTLSGPSLMMVADTAMYIALLSEIGIVPLAVTSNLNINFLRKPIQQDIIADAQLLKVGRKLAFGEVSMRNAEASEVVAHATLTYSIPNQTS